MISLKQEANREFSTILKFNIAYFDTSNLNRILRRPVDRHGTPQKGSGGDIGALLATEKSQELIDRIPIEALFLANTWPSQLCISMLDSRSTCKMPKTTIHGLEGNVSGTS